MVPIILVSHGVIAKGFYDSMPMLVGDNAGIQYVCLQESMSPQDFQQALDAVFSHIPIDCESLVIGDLCNGSPVRLTYEYMQTHCRKGKIVCGMNLGMLLEAYMNRHSHYEIDRLLCAASASVIDPSAKIALREMDE